MSEIMEVLLGNPVVVLLGILLIAVGAIYLGEKLIRGKFVEHLVNKLTAVFAKSTNKQLHQENTVHSGIDPLTIITLSQLYFSILERFTEQRKGSKLSVGDYTNIVSKLTEACAELCLKNPKDFEMNSTFSLLEQFYKTISTIVNKSGDDREKIEEIKKVIAAVETIHGFATAFLDKKDV